MKDDTDIEEISKLVRVFLDEPGVLDEHVGYLVQKSEGVDVEADVLGTNARLLDQVYHLARLILYSHFQHWEGLFYYFLSSLFQFHELKGIFRLP